MKKLAFLLAVVSLFAVLAMAADAGMATTVQGYVTDSACAAHGNKMCSEKSHVMNDNPMVLVSDADASILTLKSPGKLGNHMGKHVEVKGVVNPAEKTIEVKNFKILK
ncbi:MAG: hypothetical protein HY233_00260 [Acidobacteriales bacterium]|nr:hypothetical protein [Terriglobales bacterium]